MKVSNSYLPLTIEETAFIPYNMYMYIGGLVGTKIRSVQNAVEGYCTTCLAKVTRGNNNLPTVAVDRVGIVQND